MAGQRVKGTVRWFNRTKGYGFIRPDEGDRDVFVHYTAIVGQGFRNLEEGERVELTIRETPKGLQAEQVVRLSE